MEKTVEVAKISPIALIFRLAIDFFAICILVGIAWIPRDISRFRSTKLEITNKRLRGKTGLLNTNELDSPLNKINGIQVLQGMFGKIFNYGTLKITTASSVFEFCFIENPNQFKAILNNQIEEYDNERIEKQATRLANAIKN